MNSGDTNLSFKNLFVWVVVGITSITLLLSAGLSLYFNVNSLKVETVQRLETTGKIVANNVAEDVATGFNDGAKTKLSSLAFQSNISNAHIYWTGRNGSQEFFTSYNRRGQSTLENKINLLDKLDSVRQTGNLLEVVIPIEFENNKVGSLYLRATSDDLSNVINGSLILHGVIFLVLVCMGFLLSLKLQKIYTHPIEKLSVLLQQVAQSKNYSLRADSYSMKEVDLLSTSVNILLSRIQDVIGKQLEVEAQHKKLNSNLEQIVNQRTVALKEANHELIQTLEKLHQFQRQIVQNEKMASLGDMVAGIAHEVNTPIGLGVTASTMMLDRLKTIKNGFESKTLKASSMAKFIGESEENLNIIYRNLNRAAELISSFKQVAVDQSSEIDRVVNIKQLLNEILVSLHPQIKKTSHNITIDCAEDLIVETKAGPINQIIINLVVNSLIHAFEHEDSGEISIAVSLENDTNLQCIYKDNGSGIPKTILKRIFDPFVTTKRGQGGSGLGMHLVYNLVTQGLNGSISLSSDEGKGVEFIILFPVKKISA